MREDLDSLKLEIDDFKKQMKINSDKIDLMFKRILSFNLYHQ